MSKNIYYPKTLAEIDDILNAGKAVCNECGAVMELINCGVHPDKYVCPDEECGWECLVEDYYYGDEPPEDIPEGCRACGGPYPQCMISCKMFDD